MSIKTKIVVVACAGALAMTGVTPAFADVNKDGGTSDVSISAAVAKEGEKIISVTMPSQMAVAIRTEDNTGKFKSAVASQADIVNNAVSTTAVKVDIAKVAQTAGVDSGSKLLDLVDLKLHGEQGADITLSENATGTLFSRIDVGGKYQLKVDAAANTANGVIPSDSYTVNTTLKVTAVS